MRYLAVKVKRLMLRWSLKYLSIKSATYPGRSADFQVVLLSSAGDDSDEWCHSTTQRGRYRRCSSDTARILPYKQPVDVFVFRSDALATPTPYSPLPMPKRRATVCLPPDYHWTGRCLMNPPPPLARRRSPWSSHAICKVSCCRRQYRQQLASLSWARCRPGWLVARVWMSSSTR